MDQKRRGFLQKIAGILGGVLAVPILGGLAQYLEPVDRQETQRESIEVGDANELSPGSARVVAFNRQPVILVRLGNGQFKAFGARCTHLGCVVQFQSTEQPHFVCNCHGSQFDITGRNIAGPAPRPLQPFRVNLQKTTLTISKI
jgi:cytochrome b6-f complex iron-sulfur subunit